MFCPKCGKEVEASNNYCPGCGVAVSPVAIVKSRNIYVILAFFLGAFGVHNFYAGYTTKALIQLIMGAIGLTGFSYLWAIINIITTTEDAQGIPMRGGNLGCIAILLFLVLFALLGLGFGAPWLITVMTVQ